MVIGKRYFWSCHKRRKKKYSESPQGIEPQSIDALPLSHKDSMVSEVYYEVRKTRVSHTAKITNVDSVLFVNRMREMVSFELGTEIKKDLSLFLSSCHETRQKTCFNSVNN